ncbi:DNA cross-link repair 1A protein [Rhizoclosmatium sp. JEL0117]|nr:DNA cross-link repair 1A protein [Rhizoclosmatium sp. JEL0117]
MSIESDDDVFEAIRQPPPRPTPKQKSLDSHESRTLSECPVCGVSLKLFDSQATKLTSNRKAKAAEVHANNCLDSIGRVSTNAPFPIRGSSSTQKQHPLFSSATSTYSPQLASSKSAPSKKRFSKSKTVESAKKKPKPATIPKQKQPVQQSISFPKSIPSNLSNHNLAKPLACESVQENVGLVAEPTNTLLENDFNDDRDDDNIGLDEEYNLEPSLSRDDSVVSNLNIDVALDEAVNTNSTESIPSRSSYYSNSKRECPWYKKLPGTGFTIDAFSYGAIEGCSAYFLSHFHSDHYGGLTSKFTAGPIYCSKVTANLVKSQLRVDAEYIKELPMETPIEVQGVTVTLIGLAKALNCKVFAETAKRRILSQLEDEELDNMITTNPLDAAVHVIKIGQLNKEFLETKLNSVASKYARIIAIRPTGWTHHPRAAPAKPGQQSDEPAGFTLQSIKPTRLAHNIHVIPIPYSEHSSFTELKAFVKALNVEQIIPTVNISKHEMMKGMFDTWRSEG